MATAAPTTAAGPTRAGTLEKTKTRAKDPKDRTSPWLWLVVAAIIIFCLFPFYWLINVSLKTGSDLSGADLIPPNPTLANYESIFRNDDFLKALQNSAIVSLTVTLLSLVIGSFCAYALRRLRFRGKFFILALVLSVTTFPASRSRRRCSSCGPTSTSTTPSSGSSSRT
jgi:ABC-type glycerol-3-phosphate transport system permease component